MLLNEAAVDGRVDVGSGCGGGGHGRARGTVYSGELEEVKMFLPVQD